jgi:disulfide bond formation protein DsbB
VEPPICVPCGYQRIFMFPLAPILPFGLFPPDRRIIRSAPAPGPCPARWWRAATSSENVTQWFGFPTIPLLSAVAFSTIIALLVTAHRRSST